MRKVLSIDLDGLDGVLRPAAVASAPSRSFVIPMRPFTPAADQGGLADAQPTRVDAQPTRVDVRPPSVPPAPLPSAAPDLRAAGVPPRRTLAPAVMTLALATLSGSVIAIAIQVQNRRSAPPVVAYSPPPPLAGGARQAPPLVVAAAPGELPPLIATELPFPARFTFNHAPPRALDEAALRGLVGHLEQRCRRIVVVGHACAKGPEDANRAVAAERALAASEILIARGVDPARLRTESAGSARPIASNETARGRAANRRVELVCESERGEVPRD